MNQNERGTNGSSSKTEGAQPTTLPTRNSPAGDAPGKQQHGGEIKHGQPEVARGGNKSAAASNNKGGTAMKTPANEPRNDGNKR